MIEKPKILQSDNGLEFKNNILNTFLLSVNVNQVYSKSYTPQTQGAVERCNRTIKGMIFRYLTSNNTNNWVNILPQITENYNNSKHSSIGISPIDLKNSSKSLIKEVHKDNILSSKKSIIKHHRSFQPLKVYDLVRIDIKSNNKDSTFTKYYSANWSKEIYMIESISKLRDTFSNPTYFINNTFQSRNKLQKINILNKRVEIYWNSPYKGVERNSRSC